MYAYLETGCLSLIKYQASVDFDQLRKTHMSFSGSLRQHPYDVNKVILLSESHQESITYYEFDKDDIGFSEKLANIVNSKEEDLTMVTLWIKNGSVAIKSSPFFVKSVES